jgi:tetratricopeptide (TPR) repeat protein
MRPRRRPEPDENQDEREAVRVAAIEILSNLVRDYPNVPDYRCELSDMLVTTSSRRRHRNNERELAQAVSLARELTETHPSIPRYRAVLARGLMQLADCQCERLSDANKLFDESISLFRSLTRNFPDMPVYRVFLVHAFHDQARTLRRLGHMDEARIAMEKAIHEQTHYVQQRRESHFGRRFLEGLKKELKEMQTTDDLGEINAP